MRYIFFLSLILAFLPSAFARVHLTYGKAATVYSAQEFHDHSTVILSQLIAGGYSHLNGMDLVHLRDLADSVKWKAKSIDEPIPKNAGSRLSAFYQEHNVNVVTDPSVVNSGLLNIIALHELFGATHIYNDNRYQLSIGMFILAGALELNMPSEANLARDHLIQVAEGGTGFGGGGDYLAILIKTRILGFLSSQGILSASDYDQITNAAIEPDWNPRNPNMHIQFDAHGKMALTFPAAAYGSMNTSARQVIERAVAGMLEIFFIRDDAWLTPLGEVRCRGHKQPIVMRGMRGGAINPQLKETVYRLFEKQNCQFDFSLGGG